MKGHAIEFLFVISFNHDQIRLKISGDAVDFEKLEPQAVVRPRHVKLAAMLGHEMREYILANQQSPARRDRTRLVLTSADAPSPQTGRETDAGPGTTSGRG